VDTVWIIVAGLFFLGGIAGSFLPVLPGPPLSFLGLIALQVTERIHFESSTILIWLGVTVAVTLLDYFIPVWGVKKFGGSEAGVRGATVGVFLGIFMFPPWGIILGPFVGALVAEKFWNPENRNALRAAFGSLVGFMLGTGLKLIACAWMLVVGVRAV
jgi:uncharacterized protein YqgC (DUF456 family)